MPLLVLVVGVTIGWLAGEGARLAGLEIGTATTIAFIASLAAMILTGIILRRLVRVAARIVREEFYTTFD